jgi:hypothetical protein
MWEPRRLTNLWASTSCCRDSLARKADNLTDICEPLLCKMLERRRLKTQWASTACYRDSFARKADNITDICEPLLCKMLERRRLKTLWASTACYRDSFTFIALIHCCYITLLRDWDMNVIDVWNYNPWEKYRDRIWVWELHSCRRKFCIISRSLWHVTVTDLQHKQADGDRKPLPFQLHFYKSFNRQVDANSIWPR